VALAVAVRVTTRRNKGVTEGDAGRTVVVGRVPGGDVAEVTLNGNLLPRGSAGWQIVLPGGPRYGSQGQHLVTSGITSASSATCSAAVPAGSQIGRPGAGRP
jgi:hypothetical protein